MRFITATAVSLSRTVVMPRGRAVVRTACAIRERRSQQAITWLSTNDARRCGLLKPRRPSPLPRVHLPCADQPSTGDLESAGSPNAETGSERLTGAHLHRSADESRTSELGDSVDLVAAACIRQVAARSPSLRLRVVATTISGRPSEPGVWHSSAIWSTYYVPTLTGAVFDRGAYRSGSSQTAS